MTEAEAIQHCKVQARMKNETNFTINNYILGTAIETLIAELEKKDKIIDLMSKSFKQDDIRTVEEIKQYFKKKAEE